MHFPLIIRLLTLELKLYTFSTYYKVAYFPYLVWGSTFTCAETYSKPIQISKMELFATILNGFQQIKMTFKKLHLNPKTARGSPPLNPLWFFENCIF